jgi:hypothetical protein
MKAAKELGELVIRPMAVPRELAIACLKKQDLELVDESDAVELFDVLEPVIWHMIRFKIKY